METPPLSYRDAGVDLDAARRHTAAISAMVAGGQTGFAAAHPIPPGMREPMLVTCTDGIGTKLLLAQELGRIGGLGQDLVAMCVNDLACTGARPLVFLDYLAVGRLDTDQAAVLVRSVADACAAVGCALAGGETAEMPGLYASGDYDLAGFAVGAAERGSLLPAPDIGAGDLVLGLASSGVHSNGYSLVRRIAAAGHAGWGSPAPFAAGQTLGEALLTPTRIYVKPVLAAHRAGLLKAAAHITGGGLPGNLPRVLPPGTVAELDAGAWTPPPVFGWLARTGEVSAEEMLRVFNCGIGMALVVAADKAKAATAMLEAAGERVFTIGRIAPGIAPGAAEAAVTIDPPDDWFR